MATIGHILKQKGHAVWTVTLQTRLMDVLALLAEKEIGAVIVKDGARIAGIFSERDFARRVARTGQAGLDTPVAELMTSLVYYVRPDQSVDEAMALMTDRRIRHLPVMQGDDVVGMISIGDLVKDVVSEKDSHIRSLENYIMGNAHMS